ncbi:TetR family transcriptional regulator [Tamaricihabitans halophyticus]|uniref:TetR family transcriptional regulator n=1 Tax=Tamaricihabitans halophyticus TaxID=1262583 RepID=A0A4R2QGU3_9PSEU|nr:TetR/AcrR family transcriptional regulator [Tamaricihabitans halophyticus]TCP48450.1 TetR family transcriptional regulator [Tamaricihabitans halophyticus]
MGRPSDARERIVRAAAKLFLTRSYQIVGVTELCAAADVRKGSFYHYFPSKADLVKAVIDLHIEALDARLSEHRTDDPVQRLRATAEAIGAIQARFEQRFGRVVGCPFGNLAAEVATTDDEIREHLAGAFQRWERRIAEACHRAAAEGALRTDPDRLAKLILGQAQGAILLAKATGSPASEVPAALRELIDAHLHLDGRQGAEHQGVGHGR